MRPVFVSRCLQVLRSFFFLSRKTPLLEQIRRRLRRAWLLHFVLIISLLILPAGRRSVRADEPGDELIFEGTER